MDSVNIDDPINAISDTGKSQLNIFKNLNINKKMASSNQVIPQIEKNHFWQDKSSKHSSSKKRKTPSDKSVSRGSRSRRKSHLNVVPENESSVNYLAFKSSKRSGIQSRRFGARSHRGGVSVSRHGNGHKISEKALKHLKKDLEK